MAMLVVFAIFVIFAGSEVVSDASAEDRDIEKKDLPSSVDPSKEYCNIETFQARCSKNEIIVIQSAIYGRMNIGKCITAEEVSGLFKDDKRYFGCSTDVTNILEAKCSLKSECDVRVIDPDLHRTNPCFPGLNLYLEASYECLNVVENDRTCQVLATPTVKHLLPSSNVDSIIGCGSNIQPWNIESPKGQRVKVTYVSIGGKKSRGSRVSHRCSAANQGIVIDKLGRRNVSVCEGSEGWSLEDDQQYYLSEGSVLHIILNQRGEDVSRFLLRIEATGCSDIIPPEDAWLKRNTDAIVIGCYSSKQTWHLHCDNRQWIGVVGNCSAEAGNIELSNSLTEEKIGSEIPDDQQVLIIIAICGFGIVVCLTIVCIGAVCMKRFTKDSDKQVDAPVLHYNSIHANDPRFASYRSSATNCHLANGNYNTAKPLLRPNHPPMGIDSTYPGNAAINGDRRMENPNDVIHVMNEEDAKYFVLDQMAVAEENAALHPY